MPHPFEKLKLLLILTPMEAKEAKEAVRLLWEEPLKGKFVAYPDSIVRRAYKRCKVLLRRR